MNKTILLLTTFLVLFANHFILAQNQKEEKERNYSNSRLFESDQPLFIKIYANNKEMFKDIGDDRKYHKALISYSLTDKKSDYLPVKIKTRGNFRRNPKNCSMPPLKLKVSKKARTTDNVFKDQYVLKLVVPCKKNAEKFQEYIIMEYLIYKAYELFDDLHYKTRLVDLELIDSLKPDKPLKMKGFFIEETKQLAEKNGGKFVKFKRFHQENIERNQMTKLAVFQYLIGNTDWSVDVGHNIKLFFKEGANVPTAVPYDFDWSGIINTNYAVPSPNLNISSVKERTFRGYKRSMEEYTPVIKLFNDKKEEVYNLFKNCEWLSDKTKSSTIKYLDEFYKIINDPKTVEREFIKNCRKV